jgi:hypothetical protein
MTLPPIPLVGSGRRPGAGPGRQSGPSPRFAQPIAGLVVIGLAGILMVGPALISVLAMTFAGRLDAPGVQLTVPFQLAPILELARVLLTVVLAAKVIRATELE